MMKSSYHLKCHKKSSLFNNPELMENITAVGLPLRAAQRRKGSSRPAGLRVPCSREEQQCSTFGTSTLMYF